MNQPEERAERDEILARERGHDQKAAEQDETALESANHQCEEQEETERVRQDRVIERPTQTKRQHRFSGRAALGLDPAGS